MRLPRVLDVPLSITCRVTQICGAHMHRASFAQGIRLCNVWGAPASQLDIPSLTPLSVTSCGRLQLSAAHWAISVALLQLVDTSPLTPW